jgi:hypothetical protein
MMQEMAADETYGHLQNTVKQSLQVDAGQQ